MTELPKTFDPATIEQRWYAHWEANGLFRPDRPNAEPWTIVNPPPNVTGSLHIGHALDNTLQDILTRHARLKGKDALWVVGTDHAGIATQMVVERQMNAAGQKRTDLSRDDFIAKVWAWKAESGGQITQPAAPPGLFDGLGRTNASRWTRAFRRPCSRSSSSCTARACSTATSASSTGTRASAPRSATSRSRRRRSKGSFWRLRYPLAERTRASSRSRRRGPKRCSPTWRSRCILTMRAIAALVGKQVRLPITGRLIAIVADEHADPELGSGAVKITPGHDFNDFEVGRRAGIEARDMLNMLDAKAQIVQTADGLIPADLLGLSTADARKAIVARLKDDGVLIPHVDKDGNEHDAEPRTIQTPFGDRSGVVIEPWLTDQWYVDAKTLAQPAIEAVRSEAIRIVPKTWEKTFFNWMENIQPWCVSRQLWWGHQIPAWFGFSKEWLEANASKTFADIGRQVFSGAGPEQMAFVGETEADVRQQAEQYYGDAWQITFSDGEEGQVPTIEGEKPAVVLIRDSDVLDTWFSSALWPFATLGWPDNTDPTLGGRYPNDVLISGFDILFFWDARMMMQGMHFLKDVPFKTLYLHGLVRAADGAEDVQVQGQYRRPARPDRYLRRRCAALLHGGDGKPGPRHQDG